LTGTLVNKHSLKPDNFAAIHFVYFRRIYKSKLIWVCIERID